MTNEQLNKAVAEKLGWYADEYWYFEKGNKEKGSVEYVGSWEPSKNLQQAVDHIVPVLNEMGFEDVWLGTEDAVSFGCTISKWHPEKQWTETIAEESQGSTPSERMAWALCEVFLKVKESDHAHI